MECILHWTSPLDPNDGTHACGSIVFDNIVACMEEAARAAQCGFTCYIELLESA